MTSYTHTEACPEILATDDIARLANRLIAEIAADMLADGARADEITYMRHDLITTFCTYCPNLFQRRARHVLATRRGNR